MAPTAGRSRCWRLYHDRRVDAIAPQITYWNLADALFPHGVFKKLWAGIFFTTGSAGTATGSPGPAPTTSGGCGRFEPELCRMYQRVAVHGFYRTTPPGSSSRAAARPPSATASRCRP